MIAMTARDALGRSIEVHAVGTRIRYLGPELAEIGTITGWAWIGDSFDFYVVDGTRYVLPEQITHAS